MKKRYQPTLWLAAALLAGCGGGGDAVGPANGAPQEGIPPADKYVGTWTTGCTPSAYAAEGAPDVPLSKTTTLVFTRLSDTQLTFETIEQVYKAAPCQGEPTVLPHARNGNLLQIDGTVDLGGRWADQVTVVSAPINPGISSGVSITLNGIVLPGDYFSDSGEVKDLFSVAGSELLTGGSASASDGYPAGLDETYPFVRP